MRQIPGGSVGSIVRLTSLDNAKSAPVRGRTVALHRSRSHDGNGAMSAVEDPGAEPTPAELPDLRRLAAFMVPASAEYGVPGADDEQSSRTSSVRRWGEARRESRIGKRYADRDAPSPG